MTDKDLRLTSSPETEPPWPVPPEYVPPWSSKRVEETVDVCAADEYDKESVRILMTYMKDEYDKALSAALFENWQLKGLLKGRRDGT